MYYGNFPVKYAPQKRTQKFFKKLGSNFLFQTKIYTRVTNWSMMKYSTVMSSIYSLLRHAVQN